MFNAELELQVGPKLEIPITVDEANLEVSNEVSVELSASLFGQGGGAKRTFWSSDNPNEKRELVGKSSVAGGGLEKQGKTAYEGGKWGVKVIFGFSLDINWAAVGDIFSRPNYPDLSKTCPSQACQK